MHWAIGEKAAVPNGAGPQLGQAVEEWVLLALADAARGEQEPVHEDPAAFAAVGVVGHQAVPLVLLLATAVASAPDGGPLSGGKMSKGRIVDLQPT